MFSKKLICEIEDYFRQKTGRDACFLPSARLGIYATLCELFPAGAGLALSPVTDDIVVFAILAAGLVPIFMDIDPKSGGLLPDSIPSAVSAGAMGILTSNLYGIPDDVVSLKKICDAHGLILLEDCAHAMGCEADGQRVGTFGAVSIFSLAKHIGVRGGAVTSANPELLNRIKAHAERYVTRLSNTAEFVESAREIVSDAFAPFPKIRTILKALASPLLLFSPNREGSDAEGFQREGHRVPVHGEDFEGWKERKGIEHYHRYLEVDNLRYREIPCFSTLRKIADGLRHFDERALSYQKASDLIDPTLAIQRGLPGKGTLACYFKMPFFLKDKDRHVNRLTALGIELSHIYDPPFPYYLPSGLFENCITDKETALLFSRDILPIPLTQIEKACAYFLACDEFLACDLQDAHDG